MSLSSPLPMLCCPRLPTKHTSLLQMYNAHLYFLQLVPLLTLQGGVWCCLSTTCTTAAHCHPCNTEPASKRHREGTLCKPTVEISAVCHAAEAAMQAVGLSTAAVNVTHSCTALQWCPDLCKCRLTTGLPTAAESHASEPPLLNTRPSV